MEHAYEELQQYINVLPVLKKVFPYEVGISLADRENIIMFLPTDTLNISVKVGSPIKEGTGIWMAIHEGKRIFFRADKSVRRCLYCLFLPNNQQGRRNYRCNNSCRIYPKI